MHKLLNYLKFTDGEVAGGEVQWGERERERENELDKRLVSDERADRVTGLPPHNSKQSVTSGRGGVFKTSRVGNSDMPHNFGSEEFRQPPPHRRDDLVDGSGGEYGKRAGTRSARGWVSSRICIGGPFVFFLFSFFPNRGPAPVWSQYGTVVWQDS